MIRSTISVAAYAALATALPSGLGVRQERAPNGDYYVWLDRRFVDRLRAMRGPGESYSDVILKLVGYDGRSASGEYGASAPRPREPPRVLYADRRQRDQLLRNLLLINGGAAVAILAFMGSVISKDAGSHKIIGDIAGGLTYFASGVIASVTALGLTYFVHFATGLAAASQKAVWEHPYIVPGKHTAWLARLKIGLHILAVALAVLSAVLFVISLLAVKNAVTSFPA
jgi:hypothetical protein